MNNDSSSKRAVSVWTALFLFLGAQFLPLGALAQGTPDGTAAGQSAGTSSTSASGSSSNDASHNLDLTATSGAYAAHAEGTLVVGGTLGANGQVAGGTAMSITQGQMLTPAQFLALTQVLNGGQSLLLDASGAAAGGSFNLAASGTNLGSGASALSITNSLGSLVIPQAVSLNAIGFHIDNPLNVSGNANILGSFYALQTAPNMTAALNFGNNLSIGTNGLLSGFMPGGLNIAGLFASNGMNVSVANNFTNNGMVTTPGTLNLSVGGTINNATLAAAANPASFVAQNINILSGSGNIFNSGIMRAMETLNLNTIDPNTNLIIQNTGGVMEAIGSQDLVTNEALSGIINVREQGYSLKTSIDLLGGDFLSNTLNIYGGDGRADTFANDITGTVNIYAGEAHVWAVTPTLSLGTMVITGDPTFYNNAGGIVIGGNLIFSEAISIIASGDITVSNTGGANNYTISSNNSQSQINLIAGANITNSPPFATTVANGGAKTANNDVDFNNTSATGGSINLVNGDDRVGLIDTTSGSDGRIVRIIAYQAAGGGGGEVIMPTTNINTGGGGSGTNGNILVIAGDTDGLGISLGNLNTTGGTSVGGGNDSGDVQIFAAQPNDGGGGRQASSSGVLNGDITPNARVTSNISIASITAFGDVTIQNNGGVISSTGNIISTNGNVGISSTSGSINLGGSTTSSNSTVSLTAATGVGAGAVTSNGLMTITNSGAGNISVGALQNNNNSTAINVTLSGNGNITTGNITNSNSAGGDTSNGNNVNILSASTINGSSIVTGGINTAGTTNNSAGGDVVVRYTAGSANSSSITINGTVNAVGFQTAGFSAQGGDININTDNFSNGTINVQGSLLATASRGNNAGTAAGNITLSANGAGASNSLQVNGNINADISNPANDNENAGNINITVRGSGNLMINSGVNAANNISGNISAVNTDVGGTHGGDINITQNGSGAIGFAGGGNAVRADNTIVVQSDAGGILGSAAGTGQLNADRSINGGATLTLNVTNAAGSIGSSVLNPVQIASDADGIRIGQATIPNNIYINGAFAGNMDVDTLTSTGDIRANNDIYIGNNGQITLNDTLISNSGNGTVTVQSFSGNIKGNGAALAIQSTNGSAVLLTSNGDIGTGTGDNSIRTLVANVQATSLGGSKDVFITDNDGVTVNGVSSATGVFNLQTKAAGTLGVGAAVSGNGVSLITNNGDINIGATVTSNNGNLVATANGGTSKISITAAGLNPAFQTVGSGDVNLTAGSGGLISSGNQLFITSAGNLNVNMGGALISTSGAAAGGALNFQTTNGTINLNGSNISTNGTGVNQAGNVTINTGKGLTMGSISAQGAGAAGLVGNVQITNGPTSGAISITSINTTGSGVADAGSINVSNTFNDKNGDVTLTALTSKNTGTGAGGTITVNSVGGDVVVGAIDSSSAGAAGGRVDLTSALTLTLNAGVFSSGSSGGAVNLIARGGDLAIGAGSITTGGGSLVAVSGKNITQNGAVNWNIDTSGAAGGGNVILAAGATVGTGLNTVSLATGGTGGTIILENGANGLANINTQGTAGAANGGSVTMLSYTQAAALFMNKIDGTISTGGFGAGSNGNVTIIGNTSNAAAAGTIVMALDGQTFNTTGGTGGNGNITIANAAVTGNVTYSTINGNVAAGGVAPSGTGGNGMAVVGPLTTTAGNIALSSGGNFEVRGGNLTSTTGNISLTSSSGVIRVGAGGISTAGDVTVNQNSATALNVTSGANADGNIFGAVSGNNISLTNSGGNVVVSGNVTSSTGSGIISVTAGGAGGTISTGANTLISTSGSARLSAPGAITARTQVNTLAANGASVDVTEADGVTLDAVSALNNGATGLYQVISTTGNLVVNQGISAGSIALETQGAGNGIVLNGAAGTLNGSTGSVSLKTNNGNVTTNGGSLTITANTTATVNLQGGNIDLTANVGKSVSITGQTGVNLSGSNISTTNGFVTIDASGSANGSITNGADITTAGGNVLLNSGTTSGNISVGNINTDVGAGTAGSITADGAGTFSSGSLSAQASGSGNAINVGSTTAFSSVSVGGSVISRTNSLAAGNGAAINLRAAAGGLFIGGDVNSGALNATGTSGAISLTSGGAVTVNGNVTSRTKQGNAGAITVNYASPGILEIGNNTQASHINGIVDAGSNGAGTPGNITFNDTNGGITVRLDGTKGNIFSKNSGGTLGNVILQANGAVDFAYTAAGTQVVDGAFATAGAPTTVNISINNTNVQNMFLGNITGTGLVTIANAAGGGDITVNSNGTVQGGNITVTNNGAGNILTNNVATAGNYKTAGVLTLNATNGNIGVSAANRLTTAVTGSIAATATGGIFIGNTGNLALSGVNTAGTDFDLTTAGTLNVSSNPTATAGSLALATTGGAGNNITITTGTLSSLAADVTVSANAGTASVLTNGNNLNIQAGRSVTVNASTINTTGVASAGSVTVQNNNATNTGSISLGGIDASATAALANGGAVTVTMGAAGAGTVSVGTITTNTVTGTAGAVSITGSSSSTVSTKSITASSTGAGSANTISVVNNGNVTNGGIAMTTAGTTLKANGPLNGFGITIDASGSGGGALNLGGLTLVDSSTAGLGSGGNITVKGASITNNVAANTVVNAGAGVGGTGGTIAITTTSTTSDLNFGTGVSSFGITDTNLNSTANLSAGRSLLNPGGAATAVNNLTLTAGATSGNIGVNAGSRFNVTGTKNLALNATAAGPNGNAFVQTGAITLAAGFNVNNTLDIQASGAITVTGAVANSSTINLTTTAGDIVINNALGDATTTNITLNSANNITNNGSGLVQATNVTLTANTGVGNIGAGTAQNTKAGTLTVTAKGNANINETDAVSLLTSSALGTFDMKSGGTLTLSGGAGATPNLTSGGGIHLTVTGGDILSSSTATNTLESTTGTNIQLTVGVGNQIATTGANAFTVNSSRHLIVDGGTTSISGTSGGNISLTAVGDVSATGVAINTNSAAGNASNITVRSTGGSGTITIGSLTANGGGAAGNGGTIILENDSTNVLTATGTISATGAGTGAGGTVRLINNGSGGSNGGINLTGLTADVSAGGAGGTLQIDALGNGNGTINFNGATGFNVSAGAGAGGTIDIQGKNFTNVGAGVALTADAAGGALGNITLATTNGAINLGTAAGAFNLTSGGTAKSNWTVTAGGAGNDLTLSADHATDGTVTFSSGAATNINANLTSNNATTSAVSITSGTNITRTGASTVTTSNAAGRVNLVALAGGDIGATGTLFQTNARAVNITTSGATGDAYVTNAGGATTLNVVGLGHDLTFNNTGGGVVTLANAAIASANNGAVSINSTGAAGGISAATNTAITTNTAAGAGGDVTLTSATGAINLGTGAVTTSGNGGNNAAGTITINATAGNVTTGALSSIGQGNGNGGAIAVTSGGATGIVAQGNVNANSTGGGTAGTVNLSSSSGLRVNGNVSSTGGTANSVTLAANTANLTFNSGAAANTVSGTVSGGAVSITNAGGNITLNANAANAISQSSSVGIVAGTAATIAGSIIAAAGASSRIVSSGSVSLTAHNGGSIGGVDRVRVQTANNATVTVSTTGAGSAFIDDMGAGTKTNLNTPSLGANLTYEKTGAGELALASDMTATGTVNLSISGGAGSITNATTKTIAANSLVLSTSNGAIGAAAAGNRIQIQAANLQASAAGGGNGVFVQGSQTGAGNLNINGASGATNGTFDLTMNNAGNVTVSAPITADSVSIVTNAAGGGNINLNVAGTAVSADNGNVTLTANGAASSINVLNSTAANTVETTGGTGNITMQAGTGGLTTGGRQFNVVASPAVSSGTVTATLGGILDTRGPAAGGAVLFRSQSGNGSVNITNNINTSGNAAGGVGGAVTLRASRNVTSGSITAQGLIAGSAGGAVTLDSSAGGEIRVNGAINNTGFGGAANIDITENNVAALNLNTNVNAANTISGGITSSGAVNITNSGGNINIASVAGSPGNAIANSTSINLSAGNGATTGSITSTNNAKNVLVSTGAISLNAGNGGSIGGTVAAGTEIKTSAGINAFVTVNTTGNGDVAVANSSGQNVRLNVTSLGRSIDFRSTGAGSVNLASNVTSLNNGNIFISANAGDITGAANLQTSNAGTVTLTTADGGISTGSITTSAGGGNNAGLIRINVGGGSGRNLSTGALSAATANGTSGGVDIDINGASSMTIGGNINTSSTGGTAGAILLDANGVGGSIRVNGNLNAAGGGTPGQVRVLQDNSATALTFNTGGAGGVNTISGTVDGAAVTLTNTGTSGIQFSNNSATAVTSTSLDVTAGAAAVNGSINGGAGASGILQSTGAITLTAENGGSIGIGSAVRTNSSNVNINTTAAGSATVVSTNAAGAVTVNLGLADAGAGTINTLNFSDTNGGGIIIGSNITSVSGTIQLASSGGAGTITRSGAFTLASPTGSVILTTAGAGANSIGAAGAANVILTTAQNLTVNASGTGNVFLTETDGATFVGPNGAGSNFNYVSNSGTTVLNNGASLIVGGNTVLTTLGGGTTTINGSIAGTGSVTLNNGTGGTALTANFGSTAVVTSGNLIVTTSGANDALNLGFASGASVGTTGIASITSTGNMLVDVSGGGTATLSATGGTTFAPSAGRTLGFTAPAASTLQINGGALAVNTSGATTVGAGVTLSTANNQTWTVNGGNSLTVNGVISNQNAGGTTTIRSTAGDLTLTNSVGTGQINMNSNNAGNILNVTSAGNLTLGGALTFAMRSAGNGGTANFSAANGAFGMNVQQSANHQVGNTAAVNYTANTMTFLGTTAPGARIGASQSSVVTLSSYAGNNLLVQGGNTSFGTVTALGGAGNVNIWAPGANGVTFHNNGGAPVDFFLTTDANTTTLGQAGNAIPVIEQFVTVNATGNVNTPAGIDVQGSLISGAAYTFTGSLLNLTGTIQGSSVTINNDPSLVNKNLTIRSPGGGTGRIIATTGALTIASTNGLNFVSSTAAPTTVILDNRSGAGVTMSYGLENPVVNQPLVASNVTVNVTNQTGAVPNPANLNLTINGNSNTFNNQGTINVTGNTNITYTGGGNHTFVNDGAGSLTSNVNWTNGNPMQLLAPSNVSVIANNGNLALSGSAPIQVLGDAALNTNSINFASNVGILALNSTRSFIAGDNGSVNFTGGTDITVAGGVDINTGLAAASKMSTFTLTTPALNMNANSSFTTTETTGTAMTVQASAGSNLAINLLGTNTSFNTGAGSKTVIVNANAGQSLTVNGAVAGTALQANSTGGFELAVNGGNFSNNTNISTTNSLLVEGRNGAAAANITFVNSGNLYAGDGNVVTLRGNNVTLNPAVALTLSNTTGPVGNNSNLAVVANNLNLSNGSSINIPGTTASFDNNTVDLVVNTTGTANVNFTGGAGAYTFLPNAGNAVTFNGNGDRLNLNNGTVTVGTAAQGHNVTIGTGHTLHVDSNTTLNLNGSQFSNAGTLMSSAAGGSVNLISNNTAMSVTGGGTIRNDGVANNALNISLNAGTNTLTFAGNQNLIAPIAGSQVSISGNTIAFQNGAVVNVTAHAGNNLEVTTTGISVNGTTGAINTVTAGQNIDFNTSTGFSVNSTGGGTSFTANTTGGVVNINPDNANLPGGLNIGNTGAIDFITNSNLNVRTRDVNLAAGGRIDANGQTITFTPDAGVTTALGGITLGGAGGSGAVFELSGAELENIRAGVVTIASSANPANMSLDSMNVSGGGFGGYTMILNSTGTLTQAGGVVQGTDMTFNNPGRVINLTNTNLSTLRFNGSTVTVNNSGAGALTINGVGGTISTVGTALSLTSAGSILMDPAASVNFTGATRTATLNGTNLGTAADPLVFTANNNNARLTLNVGGTPGTVNVQSGIGGSLLSMQTGGPITATGAINLRTHNLLNNNAINSTGGVTTLTNAGRNGDIGTGMVVTGTGSVNGNTILLNSTGTFALTQTGIGNLGGVLGGTIGSTFDMSVTGAQTSINIGSTPGVLLSSGGAMTMTFNGGGTGAFALNLGNELRSGTLGNAGDNMSITVTNADLDIAHTANTKVHAGAGAGNAVILTSNGGEVNANFESATGIIRGSASGSNVANHTDFSVTVYDNGGASFGGGGLVTAGISSANGSVSLRAMDPTAPNLNLTDPTGGGAIGRGGSLLVVDNSFIKAFRDITVVARQNITVGNVQSYDQNADPSAAGGPGAANPITPNPGGSLGVKMEAGAFDPTFAGIPANLTDPSSLITQINGTQNMIPYDAVTSVGRIVIDNRNPSAPGQQLPGTAVGGVVGVSVDAGAWEEFGTTFRNVMMGANVSVVAIGGSTVTNAVPTTGPDTNTVTNTSQVTFGGGVQITSANTVAADVNLTVGSYGGSVVLDGANGILLSNNNPGTNLSGGNLDTPTNNLFSIAQQAAPVSGAGTPGAIFYNVRITPSVTGGITSMPLYSGGQLGVYAGVPLGPREMTITQGGGGKVVTFAPGAPIVSIQDHMFNLVLNRDVFSYLTVVNTTITPPGTTVQTGFDPTPTSNRLAGTGGSLVIVLTESLSQQTSKVTNGISIDMRGGTFVLDPPPTGAFVNLGGATQVLSVAPLLVPPPGVVAPGGTAGGFVVNVTNPTLNLNFITAGVGTDSTRTVTLSLNQTAQNMLGGNELKKNKDMEGQGAYYVAGGACQPFFLEDDQDTMIVGEQGTTLSPGDKRSITLNQGKVVAMVGKQPVKVETGFGNVQIAGNSAAIIQQTAQGVVRVANLSGKAASVTVTRNGKTETIVAEAGEEICLADEALAEEELIPVDGVDREPIKGSITVPGLKLAKSKFDQKMMVEKEKLLVCNAGSFYQAKSKINNLKKDVDANAKPLRSGGAAPAGPAPKPMLKGMIEMPVMPVASEVSEDQLMKPIAFMQNTGASSSIRTFSTHSAMVRHDGKAILSFEHPTIMQLTKGETLVQAEKLTVIKTPHSMVTINPGTIALVSVVDGVTKVRNLWETGNGTIRQSVNGKFVDIAAGQESVLGNSESVVNKALMKDAVGRRKIRNIEVPGGMRMERSEVSLVSVMQNVNFIADLVNSSNAGDQALVNKLVKMAAVVSQVTAKHGQYQQAPAAR